MSAVIKTATPFIDLECLCKALESVDCGFRVEGNKVVTNRKDVRLGFQEFQKDNFGRYALFAYSHTDRNQADFIRTVEKQYNVIYQNKLKETERLRLEEERKRLEQERLAFIDKQRTTIIERAKEQGYSVKEENIKGKIKLVLVRNTY
ncbi:MAG: hypothetical protein LC115_00225 [Bacteroidia bacterium]|nr:hypothetical protein [Bacteroidia bacterium]